jgi:S1-C subfamily serine protease
MSIRRPFNFKLSLIILCCLLSSCSYGQSSVNNKKPEAEKKNETTAANNINNLLKKQILLTNEAQFTKNRTLEGASGFLIKYNGANFAVTARHLLGDAGGVEPEVDINELNKALVKWEMKPRVMTKSEKETVKLSANGLDFSQSINDIVLLKVVSDGFEIEPLTPNFILPTPGETLYVIGCPYIETNCKQNSYTVKYIDFDDAENSLVGEINSKVDLSGFSGAPLVNGKGEVVGVLTGGGATGGKNYVGATPIKEIQKIKF